MALIQLVEALSVTQKTFELCWGYQELLDMWGRPCSFIIRKGMKISENSSFYEKKKILTVNYIKQQQQQKLSIDFCEGNWSLFNFFYLLIDF